MLTINKSTRIPDVAETCATLTRHNDRLGVCIDYDKLLTYFSYYTILGRKKRIQLQKYLNYTGDKMGDDDFLRIILKLGVKEGLLTAQSGSLSASAPSLQNAIDTGRYSEEAVVVMQKYQELSGIEYAESSIRKLTAWEPVNMPTYDGHRMIIVHPTWVPQNTGRVAMRNPAIQNISKKLKDILTVPKGWVLYECDSSQVEPRIIYSVYIPDKQIKALINIYNDAYFGILHYVNMPVEDLTSGRTDFTAHEITEEMTEMRQALKRLGNGVMYGKQSNPGNDPLTARYIERIGNNPFRVRWSNQMEEMIDSGKTIFPTYFGTPIDISVGDGRDKYMDNPKALRGHDLRCAINNPIQGTAADLMRYSVMYADHHLSRNCPNSVILTYTHDSGKFAVYEDEYDDAMKVLRDVVAYQVEGWIPILSDGEEGRTKGAFPDVF